MGVEAHPYRKMRDERYCYRGMFTDGGICRVRIFEAAELPPIVVLTELPENENTSVTNLVEFLAAEVISKFLPHRWDCDPPAVVLEHYPPRRSARFPERRGGKPDYDLVSFSSWRPHAVWQSGIKRITLGEPDWRHLTHEEAAALIGEDEIDA